MNKEWVRLTPEGIETVHHYKAAAIDGMHLIGIRSAAYPHLLDKGLYLSDAELDALAAHAPAVASLVDAVRRFCVEVDNEVLEHLYSQDNRPLAEYMLEKRDRLAVSLATFDKTGIDNGT